MSDADAIVNKLAGRFLVIDGPDGAGKGTQISLLLELLAAHGVAATAAHDPGGTRAGDLIRQILLSPRNGEPLDARAETLLFMASRAQLVAEVIRPALAAGRAVVCDRFISATCAYQGAAGADIEMILSLGRVAVGDTWPDLTLVLDLDAQEGLTRIGAARTGRAARSRDAAGQAMLFRDAAPDAMESRSLAFHRKVRDIFRSLPDRFPKPVTLVDASGPPPVVHQRILEAIGRADL